MPGICPYLVYFIIYPSGKPNGDLIYNELTTRRKGPISRPLLSRQSISRLYGEYNQSQIVLIQCNYPIQDLGTLK